MTFITLRGNRESLSENSVEFKKRIIEYMQARGYILVSDSGSDGTLPDLIFKRPYIEGERETWVETKDEDLSIKNPLFLSEIGRYFNAYAKRKENQKFQFIIFIRKCKSQSKWKNIFEETKGYESDIQEFYDSIGDCLKEKDKEEFDMTSKDNFLAFINDTTLFEGGYINLLEKTNILDESKKFHVDKSLLKDTSNVLFTKETLTSNVLKVTKFPNRVWIAELTKNFDYGEFWKNNYDEIAVFHNKYIYSLKPIELNENVLRFINPKSIRQINIKITKEYEDINIIKQLIKKFVIYRAKKTGCKYDSELNCVFFPHRHLRQTNWKIGGRITSKVYRRKDGQINFVRHDGMTIDVNYINEEYHLILDIIRLFTSEGREIIRGDNARKIHYKFTKEFTFNDTEKSKLIYWINIFQFGNTTISKQDFFSFSSLITVDSPITCDNGEEFNINLSDFLEREESDEL